MTIIRGKISDLPEINLVIAQAVMAWPMPERIKRLSVPVLCYDSEDFKHYQFMLYQQGDSSAGVVVWNAQTLVKTAKGQGYLMHGLYVAPNCQGRGIGRQLMQQVFSRAADAGADGVLVKAERAALGFFEQCGLEPLPAISQTDYPYQFWHKLS